MSAPKNDLRTPQIFHAPIPRSPHLNFNTLIDEQGTELCECYDRPIREMKEPDEDIIQAQIAYDERLAKEKEKAMVEAYRAKLFKNVLGTPQGKK